MHSPHSLRQRLPLLDKELAIPIGIAYAVGMAAALVLTMVTDLGLWLYGILGALVASFFVGRFLGQTIWPRIGLMASEAALRFHLRRREQGALLHLTPFQDFPSSTMRKTAEATAFATGLAVLIAGGIVVALSEPSAGGLVTAAAVAFLAGIALTVVLVPRWLFSRLGARIEERGRFIVRSLAEEHGRIMHVSDGAIVVFALFFGVNVLAPVMDRLEGGFVVLGLLLALASVSVVTMGTGAAYFARQEERLVKDLSATAKRIGFNDRWKKLPHPARV